MLTAGQLWIRNPNAPIWVAPIYFLSSYLGEFNQVPPDYLVQQEYMNEKIFEFICEYATAAFRSMDIDTLNMRFR